MSHGASRLPHGRLILVKTSAWLMSERDAQLTGMRYPPKHDAHVSDEVAYGDFLRLVLDADKPGRAWFRHEGRDGNADTSYVPSAEARRFIGQTETELDHHREQLRLDSARLTSEPRRRMDALRHRIFFDAERVAAVTGTSPGSVPFWVLLDMRFSSRFDQLRCHASISVWSAPPIYGQHRPDEVADEGGGAPVSLAECKPVFETVAVNIEALLEDFLSPLILRVYRRDYLMPTFWVAVPLQPLVDAMKYLDSKVVAEPESVSWLEWTSQRTYEVLGLSDALDHDVTRSVLNGMFLVLRRVIRTDFEEWRDGSQHVPTYLVLPGTRDLSRDNAAVPPSQETLSRWKHVEKEAADLINDLTDLEAELADLLLFHTRELEIWSNHLRVYNRVVERGSVLWDALSTHLMIRWGAPFERAHDAVDMIHQVLQQAVADLRLIATLTEQTVARIGEVANTVQDKYDQNIGEHNRPDEEGLRAALTVTGLFGRTVRLGQEVTGRAERAKTAFDDLLRAISGAFDERRIRELDGTQKAGLLVGVFAGLFGLVTVIDATVNMKPDDLVWIFGDSEIFRAAAFWSTWGLGFLVILALTLLGVQVLQIGKLGTREFRELYHGRNFRAWVRSWFRRKPASFRRTGGLWKFLKDTSTDSQKRLRIDHEEARVDVWTKAWLDHDRQCAKELAVIWDKALNLPDAERSDQYQKDIKGLSHLIEQWGTHCLILTERARVMHWFDLPNLTCLYRCCTNIKRSFLQFSHLEDSPSLTMVADIDILLSMMRLGFSREEAQRIDRWLAAGTFKSAEHAYNAVRKLDLSLGMNEVARQATMDAIATPIGASGDVRAAALDEDDVAPAVSMAGDPLP